MVGAVVGNVISRASSPSSARPDSTLKMAETSGMAAATSEPNMASSSTSAQASPMTSDLMSLVFWPISPAPAPYSTCRPAFVTGATALLSLSR